MKRRLIITTIIASLFFSMVSYAGTWTGSDETGWRYQNDDGTYATSTWVQDTDGSWYCFGEDSVMLHDTWAEGLYYLGSSGAMLADTVTPDGYQVGPDGRWIPGPSSEQAAAEQTAAEGSSAGEAVTQEEKPSFDEIIEVFRAACSESSSDEVQVGNIYNAGNNTIAMTMNFIGDSYSSEMEAFLVEAVAAELKGTWNELLDMVSAEYGERVHLDMSYTYNGKLYNTVFYQ